MHVKNREEWDAERGELLDALREFATVMKRAPFRNSSGVRGVSAFALWWFVRRSAPAVVFESGVWKGFSTWLIEQAAPRADVFCFDPIFALRRMRWLIGRTYRSPRAHYSWQDFSCADIPSMIGGRANPLAFFDDHQNKWARVEQCRRYGISDLVFDDNYAGVSTHRSLEDEPRALLETEIDRYETFPALWSWELRHRNLHMGGEGMGFPVEPELAAIYRERKWHSHVTYVRLLPR